MHDEDRRPETAADDRTTAGDGSWQTSAVLAPLLAVMLCGPPASAGPAAVEDAPTTEGSPPSEDAGPAPAPQEPAPSMGAGDDAATSEPTSEPVAEPTPEPEPQPEPQPDPEPAPTPEVIADAPPEPSPTNLAFDPPQDEPPPPRRHREGVFVGAFAGYLGCLTAFCEGYRGGGFGAIEVGYRHRMIGAFAGFGGGAGPGDLPDGTRFTLSDIHVQLGAMVFFARKSVVDPYASFSLGWDRTTSDIANEPRLSFSRGAVRIGAGILFFVNPWITLGPRFDIALPFAGEACRKGVVCAKIADIEEESGFTFDARDLPRIFTFSLGGRFTYPLRPPKPERDR